MRTLLITGIVFFVAGVFELCRMSIAIQHERQAGISAVAGGVGPLALIAVGIFLLLVAAAVRVARR